jgi:selenocysteine lyase/cysteine desulfurase
VSESRLSRRQVLAAAAAGSLAASSSAGAAPDLRSWAGVRSLFPLQKGVHHLAAFVFASHPAPVAAAIERHRRGLDRDAHAYLDAHQGDLEQAVANAANAYLGAAPESIAYTDSTTMGLGLLYGGLGLDPGDEVVTTEHDFYATHESWRLRSVRDHVTVRRVRLYRDAARASVDEIVSNAVAGITPKTRVLAITWVHSVSGVKLPVRQISDAVHRKNARTLVCVDGVHGFGVEDVTVDDLGCDALATGTHKWLFGPRGTGIVWARPAVWDIARPTIPSFDGRAYGGWITGRGPVGVPGAVLGTPGGFHSFEHRWALAEAFALHRRIGKRRVQERTHALATRLKDGLASIRTVRLITPRDPRLSAGIVCFDVGSQEPQRVVDELFRRRIVASVTPYAEQHVRLGAGICNGPDDVDAALRAIRSFV